MIRQQATVRHVGKAYSDISVSTSVTSQVVRSAFLIQWLEKLHVLSAKRVITRTMTDPPTGIYVRTAQTHVKTVCVITRQGIVSTVLLDFMEKYQLIKVILVGLSAVSTA